ncbi:class I tRNA ligase family protein, partial [Pseudostreptobacillus hongkongensis]|uniref:class I tRNA ligase family protein n=1 Tax=Pseudostreptobacillus hongkongensis TaxID=1162717 RepID=UPI0012E3869B
DRGQKIEESVKKNNVTSQEWIDSMKSDFIKLWYKLNIEYDEFVRTTNPTHENVQKIIETVYNNGINIVNIYPLFLPLILQPSTKSISTIVFLGLSLV